MTSLVNSSLCDKAYQAILADIISAKHQAGQKLGEENLAQEYAISRTPIREALQRLIQEGLVEQRPRCGCYVKQLHYQDIVDLFECRAYLECLALEKGFASIQHEVLDEALSLLAQSDHARLNDAFALSLQADTLMHHEIMRLSKNTAMVKILRNLHHKTQPFRTHRTLKRKNLSQVTAERRTLIQALLAKDVKPALVLLKNHITQGIPREF